MCAEQRSAGNLAAAFLLLALFLPAGRAMAAPDIRIQHWSTRDGAQVYFVAAHELPILDVQVIFDAGSARDPSDRWGLALLTASLLDEGAGGMEANRVSYEFERVGAIYGAQSDQDSAWMSLRSLTDEKKLKVALGNFARVLGHPDFPAESVERQRKRLLIGIEQKGQSPSALASDAFDAAVYGNHPYGHPGEGTADSVLTITRDDVAAFYKRYYVSRNAVIAMVGDLSTARAHRIAESLSGTLARGDHAPPLPPAPELAGPKLVKIGHSSSQMHIVVGQPGIRQGDPDYFPLYVGNHVLGGGGLTSILFQEIRERRGLSYSASSGFDPRLVEGPFAAGLQTRADQAGEALSVLRETLSKFIQDGPTAEQLHAAKQNITGGFPLRLASNGGILSFVGTIGFYKLPLDYLDTFTDKVEAVSADQIRDAFRRRIHPDDMVTVMVGPEDKMTEKPKASGEAAH